MMIIAQPVSTESFSFLRNTKAFVTDITDVINPSRLFGRLYDDACDQGFLLASQRTGRSQAYVLDKTNVMEGDLTHWEFVPVDPILPGLESTKVVVFND